jgi:hypothetical protein
MAKQHKPLKPFAKRLILFTAGIVCLVLFFILPPNREWLTTRITGSIADFTKERHNLNEEHRMAYRFNDEYTCSKQIEYLLRQKHAVANALVLLPPTSYFKQHNISYHVPEPVVFYYFTGIKTVWANCSNAANANWFAWADGGKIKIDTVINKKALIDTITALKKFDISL